MDGRQQLLEALMRRESGAATGGEFPEGMGVGGLPAGGLLGAAGGYMGGALGLPGAMSGGGNMGGLRQETGAAMTEEELEQWRRMNPPPTPGAY
jgi:hypothetical protein